MRYNMSIYMSISKPFAAKRHVPLDPEVQQAIAEGDFERWFVAQAEAASEGTDEDDPGFDPTPKGEVEFTGYRKEYR